MSQAGPSLLQPTMQMRIQKPILLSVTGAALGTSTAAYESSGWPGALYSLFGLETIRAENGTWPPQHQETRPEPQHQKTQIVENSYS